MNVHEYQAKELMRKFGIKVLNGQVATTVDQAVEGAKKLGGNIWVVKAQIHAGGRGKAGGVKLAKSLDEVKKYAGEILGATLVTHQTGPEGKKVNTLLIEEGCNIAKEFYLGIVLDRNNSKVTFMASREGGVEIEEVAHKNPDAITKIAIDPATGYQPYVGRTISNALGLDANQAKEADKFYRGLFTLYMESDCSIAEINPLVLTGDNQMIALDAKLNFDENALFRHPDIAAYRDLTEESAKEIEASKYGLSYIELDGNIGCLVNGAGLAMATLDIIKLHGGNAANFLDVGGGATKEAVEQAFRIILSDPNVKAIMVNIFGGIMKCDIIAEGIVAAARAVSLKVPLIVRLEGTNVELGKKILSESGLAITAASDLGDAAAKAVAATKGA